MNLGIRHAALGIADLERALGFYTSVLDFKPYHVSDADWAMVQEKGTSLSLAHSHPPHLGLVLDSRAAVDALHAKLSASKTMSVGRPVRHRDESYGFYFKDTEGNQLEAIFIPAVPPDRPLPECVVLLGREGWDSRELVSRLVEHAPRVRWEPAGALTLGKTLEKVAGKKTTIVPLFVEAPTAPAGVTVAAALGERDLLATSLIDAVFARL